MPSVMPSMFSSKKDKHGVPQRRLNRNDKALIRTADWNGENRTELHLEDKVSLADKNAAFLQGLVVYVGQVHFGKGTWVGIQMTGPSIGRGNCNGVIQGKKYFADVGKNNGVLVPIDKVHKRIPAVTGDPKLDQIQARRTSEQARMADLEFIDALTQTRALALLKLSEEKASKPFATMFNKEETHITRLKQLRLVELMRSRGIDMSQDESSNVNDPHLKYANRDATLCAPDLELAEGLEMTQQNYCLSDPTLPDNPITFASQAFLNMTGYSLNEILGRNCRFLQGKHTDDYSVYRIRLSIKEGADCHVCLLNYRKDGTPFYNRLFMTALRDTRGRIKNYLGVQCEVSAEVARKINADEKVKLERKLYTAQLESTQDMIHQNSQRERDNMPCEYSEASSNCTSIVSNCNTREITVINPRKANRRRSTNAENGKNGNGPRRSMERGNSTSRLIPPERQDRGADLSPPRRKSAPHLSSNQPSTSAPMAPGEEQPRRRSTDSSKSTVSGKSSTTASTKSASQTSWGYDIEDELANITRDDVYSMYQS